MDTSNSDCCSSKTMLLMSACSCPQYSLRHNGLTDTGAISLARVLQANKSLEELKQVLAYCPGMYSKKCEGLTIHNYAYKIIQWDYYCMYSCLFRLGFSPFYWMLTVIYAEIKSYSQPHSCVLSLNCILTSTVLDGMNLDLRELLHWLILWEWTKAWKYWSN